ncbi:hypothetical protein [Sulfurovum sp.]|uniref:hypothetical protein n=1 Tax=Sulfurovum sp. TaxID=1969726 RepID=UPI003569A141
MRDITKIQIPNIAFFFLFASEFTFYLLILQTGIVEYHHSVMAEIWMVPVGGVLGIVASIFIHKERQWLIPLLLFSQLVLSLNYAHANGIELFLLGLISGLTAPMLIARIDRFWVVVVALALSYTYGTYYFDVPAYQRTDIALFLSAVALSASFFSQIHRIKRNTAYSISLYSAGSIFLWLLLDAALFETLSRDSAMLLWGDNTFTWVIIISHLIGLIVAYKARDWKHNNTLLLSLFVLTYTLYTLEWQWGLSIVYPFVISYYNVIILRVLIRLPYVLLAVMALSLWAASGLGLLVSLSGSFVIAWAILTLLAMIHIGKTVEVPSLKTVGNIFSLLFPPSSRSL